MKPKIEEKVKLGYNFIVNIETKWNYLDIAIYVGTRFNTSSHEFERWLAKGIKWKSNDKVCHIET